MPRYVLSLVVLHLILLITFQSCDVASRKTSSKRSQRAKLLLILLDGFRWDYVHKNLEGFAKLKNIGVHAKYMLPAFPSMSFPNYYSLVTGLYVENHGMVMNYMYDPQRREYFMMLPHANSTQSFWWEKAEPMWITATRNKLKARLYLWPGGDVRIHGTVPSHAEPYAVHRGLITFRQHLDDALQNLKDDADLVQIYCEFTDYVGHQFGPESKELSEAVEEIDKEITNMIKKLKKLELTNQVNVVIVSDHGMTSTDAKHVKRVSLDSYFQRAHVQHVLGEGAIVGVYPQNGFQQRVYHDLSVAKEFDVWKKEDIPENFHIKNNERTPPILVLAKKGYFITALENTAIQIPFVQKSPGKVYNGYHGYDVNEVKDMRGIFYAFGPGFEKDMKIEAIRNVDVYNIMMHLLNLQPLPNNGSWKSVFNMVRGENERNGASVLFYEGISSVFICIGCIYIYSLIAFAHSVWI